MMKPDIKKLILLNFPYFLAFYYVDKISAVFRTHPLSGLLYCKDCGSKLHIRTDRRKDEYRHIARCSEYAKGKGGGAKCFTQHQIDCDTLMENIAELLRKIAKFSLDNKAEFANTSCSLYCSSWKREFFTYSVNPTLPCVL